MKITIYIPEEVKIPDNRMKDILRSYRERWHVPKAELEDMAYEDILIEAEVLDIIQLPEDWKI
jgi:hypothetical protein